MGGAGMCCTSPATAWPAACNSNSQTARRPGPPPELVSLLRPARRRLKLVTLSSCLSAAATAAETRRWLNLVVPQALEAEADAEADQAPVAALAGGSWCGGWGVRCWPCDIR